MSPARWGQIKSIFGTALSKAPSERAAFLETACGTDYELRREVETLLANQDPSSLASPAAELLNYIAAAELKTGQALAQYRIEAKLGEGGMGEVYRAYDTRLHRAVALKVLPGERLVDPEHRQRLIQEARAASALNHSNIVTVYEIGSECDTDFIAMEYVEGHSLVSEIPKQGLPAEPVLAYAVQVAAALAKAHAAGVIHRDLKPANIMLSVEGQIKLVDFGLARRMRLAESETTLTAEGGISGTVGYMSPEQVRGLPLDPRTDLFSFGVVLYEMVTGERPFTGSSAMAVCDAILHSPPRDFGDSPAPGKLKVIIRRLLEKDPGDRYASADEVYHELRALEASLAPIRSVRLSRNVWVAVGCAVILIASLASWFWRQASRQKWALGTAAPEIARLLDGEEYVRAAALAREARAVLPKDPTLEKLWTRATGEVSISSDPSGADVSIRLYSGDPNNWESLGKTPIRKIRLPQQAYVWRVVKPGFATTVFIAQPSGLPPPGAHSAFSPTVKLLPQASVPPDMQAVPGGRIPLAYPLSGARTAPVDSFLIDRHEVTNEEYKKFVDAGGYQKREFWKQPFVRDGEVVPWESAVALFRDMTGRLGPATWEVGSYPKGHEKYPVGGVSWYEAAAYGEFVGKSLPTAYHWTAASQSFGFTPLIAPGSNFTKTEAQPVGSPSALSGFGTTDMAGNVKEWTWNETSDGKRLILGGGFGEPEYMFNYTDAQSPWDRRPNFGFRCVKFGSPPSAAALARVAVTTRDYYKEKPVSDDVFRAYAGLYSYDKGELNARVEALGATEGWSRQRVTFDAAYNQERVIAYFFLPKNAPPPLQVVVYYPGGFAYADDKLDLASVEESYDFLLRSGRAIMVPIYKGTYERRDGLPGDLHPPAFFRDHATAWAKDLGRSIDYLETRNDIDARRVAYLGFSAGAAQGLILPTVEKRIKTAILSSGGFQLTVKYLPEADPFNFVPHLTIPVLMINGRYDYAFPLESSQRPLFSFLGTPAKDKRHLVYEGGHGIFPRPDAVRETLNWLDKYLGPVRH
jgi:serine/threonine protein kinase/dienelactone hydrolase